MLYNSLKEPFERIRSAIKIYGMELKWIVRRFLHRHHYRCNVHIFRKDARNATKFRQIVRAQTMCHVDILISILLMQQWNVYRQISFKEKFSTLMSYDVPSPRLGNHITRSKKAYNFTSNLWKSCKGVTTVLNSFHADLTIKSEYVKRWTCILH